MIVRLLGVVTSLLAVALIFGVVAGHGGSGRSTTSPTASAKGPITKANAVAYARAVNLRIGDIPLGSVYKPEGEVREQGPTRSEEACFSGGKDWHRFNKPIINRQSATIGWTLPHEFQRIICYVEVDPTAHIMIQHNAEVRSHRFLSCYSHFLHLESDCEAGPLEFGGKVIIRLPDPLPGIPGAYEYRTVSTVVLGRNASATPTAYVPQHVRRYFMYEDLFGFISGPAEINMTALSLLRPVPRNLEEQLLVVLYDRTQAHRL